VKYGLLTWAPSPEGTINIGDYIQSLAAKQFLDGEPVYIRMDRLSDYDGDEVGLIVNGWFTRYPDKFPPSEKIHPVFISFHVNLLAEETLLTERNIAYFKNHEPIGCRDKNTAAMLREKGIQAYFSGCLTLTLGNTYRAALPREKIYIVDPYLPSARKNLRFSLLPVFLRNRAKIMKIARSLFGKTSVKSLIKAAVFYRRYSKLWDDDVLLNAEYVTHAVRYTNDKELFDYAGKLLTKYASAKLIITSRIHAALPAAGMNTPCVFINAINESELSTCRFDGLLDVLNVVTCDGVTLINDNGIDTMNPPVKQAYAAIKDTLIAVLKKSLALP